MKSFDLICPVYNEELTVPLFFARVEKVFQKLSQKYECRLIFIDNASADNTQKLIWEIAKKFDWVSLIVMSRNFGYQCSVECGIRHSTADYTGVVDVDCEDPPEMFIGFFDWIEKGYDIVYGERQDRVEIAILKLIRKFYYRFTRATADEQFILDMAEFSLFSKMVREALCQDRNSFPFIRASIGRVGFEIKNIPYRRDPRVAGKTHYNMWRLFSFGVAGILSSSTLWLRIPTYLFPFWFAFSLVLWVGSLVSENPIYYQTLVTFGMLFIGFTLTGVSLYLARVYKNGLGRPNFYVNYRKSLMPKAQPLNSNLSTISTGHLKSNHG